MWLRGKTWQTLESKIKINKIKRILKPLALKQCSPEGHKTFGTNPSPLQTPDQPLVRRHTKKEKTKKKKKSFKIQHTAAAFRALSVWTPSEVEKRQRAWCRCVNAGGLTEAEMFEMDRTWTCKCCSICPELVEFYPQIHRFTTACSPDAANVTLLQLLQITEKWKRIRNRCGDWIRPLGGSQTLHLHRNSPSALLQQRVSIQTQQQQRRCGESERDVASDSEQLKWLTTFKYVQTSCAMRRKRWRRRRMRRESSPVTIIQWEEEAGTGQEGHDTVQTENWSRLGDPGHTTLKVTPTLWLQPFLFFYFLDFFCPDGEQKDLNRSRRRS